MNFIKLFVAVSIMIIGFCCDSEDDTLKPENHNRIVVITDYEPRADAMIRIAGRIMDSDNTATVSFLSVKPFDIHEASYLVQTAYENYPENTKFLVIIEPGEIPQRLLCYGEMSKVLVMPNNGVGSRLFLTPDNEKMKVNYVESVNGVPCKEMKFEEFYTFMAVKHEKAVTIPSDSLCLVEVNRPYKDGEIVGGEILFSDNFGNCISNIPDSLLDHLHEGDFLKVVSGSDSMFFSFGTGYSSVPTGQNVCFVNTSQRLELAVNYGNLSERYEFRSGSPIKISKGEYKIGLLLFNESTISLNTVDSTIKQLDREQITYSLIRKNAQGDKGALLGMVKTMLDSSVNMIVALTTPAAEKAAYYTTTSIPIVFSMVTNPDAAGLWDLRDNVTGLSDQRNLKSYFDFTRLLFPELKKFGRISNENENNSVYTKNELEKLAEIMGVEIITENISEVEDIEDAYERLKEEGIKCIMAVDDNTVLERIENLAAWAREDQIAIIGNGVSSVRWGALATITVDYGKIGTQTGKLVASVIRGTPADVNSYQTFPTNVVAINKTTAQSLHYVFPDSVLTMTDFEFE